jgi:hypothetical protein
MHDSLLAVANTVAANEAEENNNDDLALTMMDLVDCRQLQIDMLQLTYLEINNKLYFMERK